MLQWLKWVRSFVRSCIRSCSLFECIQTLELYNTTTTIYVTLYALLDHKHTHTHANNKKKSLANSNLYRSIGIPSNTQHTHTHTAISFQCYPNSYCRSSHHISRIVAIACSLFAPQSKLRFNECSIYIRPASSTSFSFGVNVSFVYFCAWHCVRCCARNTVLFYCALGIT